MFGELSELYQEVILDHSRQPRNFRALDGANHRAQGHNPLCGDQLTLYVDLAGEVVRDISFKGAGCAIAKASASLMTASLKGKTRTEALALAARFRDLVLAGKSDFANSDKLAAFAGVHKFPARVKCAMLAWRTLEAALTESPELVSTE
jgi:nitrogen fixation NifU-like protein